MDKTHVLPFFIFAKCMGTPVDRIQLILQNQVEMLKNGLLKRPFLGISDCFSFIKNKEGIRYFWRGNIPNLLFLRLSLSKHFPFFTQQSFGRRYGEVYLRELVFLGIFYPFNFCQTRLATDVNTTGKIAFQGMFDLSRKIWKTDKVQGFYRGFSSSCCGIFFGHGVALGLYNNYLNKPNEIVWLAYIATSIVLSYPFETVSRRMMMRSGEQSKYINFIHAFRTIVKTEQPLALYRGISLYIPHMMMLWIGFRVFATYQFNKYKV